MSRLPKVLPASALALISAGSVSYAGPVYENASGGTFTFSGQFNPAYTSFDDGDETTNQLVDNESSNSRIGFLIVQPFGENELTFQFETAFGFAGSSGFSQTSDPDNIDWDRTDLRYIDFAYKTASYGTFYAGQGSLATDGIADRDLSGTSLATSVFLGDVVGGFELRDTGGTLSGITVGDAFTAFGGSRAGRVRYDTPDFNGFILSVAYGEDILDEDSEEEYTDIGLGYSTMFGSTEVEAGLGYLKLNDPDSEDSEDVFGSVSVKLVSGVSFTFATGDRNTAGNYIYAKVGYAADWLPVGSTALSLDYYSGSDAVSDGDDSESFGLAVVQDFDRQNLEAYLGYREYSYSDDTGATYQDASSVIVGTRWRF